MLLLNRPGFTLISLLVASVPALSFEKPTYSVNLKFETKAVVLPQEQRQQILDAIQTVRAMDWCGLEAAFIAVDLENNEKGAKELANQRVAFIQEILETAGVPSRLVYGTTFAESKGSGSPNAFIEFLGGGVPKPCPYPLSPGGFRIGPGR